MKSKAHHQFLTAAALAMLLLAGSFWVKISIKNPAPPVENEAVARNSAMDAARQILSTLPATTGRSSAAPLPKKP